MPLRSVRRRSRLIWRQGKSNPPCPGARRVILATGGFSYNRAMLQQYAPSFAQHYDKLHRLATLGNDGSGIAPGPVPVGRRRWSNGARSTSRATLRRPTRCSMGILVNQQGHRFVRKMPILRTLVKPSPAKTEQKAWLIVPVSSFTRALKEAVSCGRHNFRFFGLPALANIFLGGTRFALSIPAAARSCNIDQAALRETCEIPRHRSAEQCLGPARPHPARHAQGSAAARSLSSIWRYPTATPSHPT